MTAKCGSKAAQEKYHEDADLISCYRNAVVLLLFAARRGGFRRFRATEVLAMRKQYYTKKAYTEGLPRQNVYAFLSFDQSSRRLIIS